MKMPSINDSASVGITVYTFVERRYFEASIIRIILERFIFVSFKVIVCTSSKIVSAVFLRGCDVYINRHQLQRCQFSTSNIIFTAVET
jgi:hypothetical protein